MIAGLISILMSKGLPMLADAIIGKTEKEAKKFIKDKTGIDLNTKADLKHLDKPEVVEKLTQLDVDMQKLENEKAAKELDSESKLVEMDYGEMEDARDAYLKTQESDKASWLSKEVPNILSIIITLAFVGLIYALFSNVVPDANKDVFYILIGGLGTLVNQVYSFHFGSSVGSKKKDKILHAKEQNKAKTIMDMF